MYLVKKFCNLFKIISKFSQNLVKLSQNLFKNSQK